MRAENRDIVRAALETAFTPAPSIEETRARLSRYINPDKYIQHSAVVPDGFEGLLGLIAEIRRRFPAHRVEIKRLIAEDDLVFAHCHYTYGEEDPRGKAIAEVFRVEDGRLVEHWDVIQDVPETLANANGMF